MEARIKKLEDKVKKHEEAIVIAYECLETISNIVDLQITDGLKKLAKDEDALEEGI